MHHTATTPSRTQALLCFTPASRPFCAQNEAQCFPLPSERSRAILVTAKDPSQISTGPEPLDIQGGFASGEK